MNKLILMGVLMAIGTLSHAQAQDVAFQKPAIAEMASERKIMSPPTFEFRAYDLGYELNALSPDEIENHAFGLEISRKNEIFTKRYVSKESIVPGNPRTKTIIKKPLIYNSVRDIEKYLVKSMEKGEISYESGRDILSKTLDVALNILATDTSDFEKELKTKSDDISKIELFTQRLKLIY